MSKHYCIFENLNGKSSFVTDFDNYDAADEFCASMNNFRKPGSNVTYFTRCLEQEEFDDIKNYDPTLSVITLKNGENIEQGRGWLRR